LAGKEEVVDAVDAAVVEVAAPAAAASAEGVGMGACGSGAWLLGGEMERRRLVPRRGKRNVVSRALRRLLPFR